MTYICSILESYNKESNAGLDLLGGSLSVLCAIHCLLFPTLISLSLLPNWDFLFAPATEVLIIGSTMVIASFALWTGYRKHGKTLPLVFAGLAISFLLLAGVAGQHGLFSGIGGLLFAIAHVLNWRLAH